jgi:hypothetical protein
MVARPPKALVMEMLRSWHFWSGNSGPAQRGWSLFGTASGAGSAASACIPGDDGRAHAGAGA